MKQCHQTKQVEKIEICKECGTYLFPKKTIWEDIKDYAQAIFIITIIFLAIFALVKVVFFL